MPTANYSFRLVGVPPDQALKLIECDPSLKTEDIKKLVQQAYRLNPILSLNFIYKGKVIPDGFSFSKLGLMPKKDVITVMPVQSGGSPAISIFFNFNANNLLFA